METHLIGRYLYRLPSPWAKIDERGRFIEQPLIPKEFLPPGAPSRHTPQQPHEKSQPQKATQTPRTRSDADAYFMP